MKRRIFLKSLALMPLTGTMMELNKLNKLTDSFNSAGPMPVLFIGHGSPMNAIEENEFSNEWKKIGTELPKPKAILCISAHWETKGTFVTAMQNPPTIHDFGGFPQELFDVQYPAPGSPELAQDVKNLGEKPQIDLDQKWGLDHGCWSILKHMYPKADTPIIQMSLDYYQSPKSHYSLAKELSALRNKGVLIIGSGNIVHNLGRLDWGRLNEIGYGFDWAIEANETMKKLILANDYPKLINYTAQGRAFDYAIPSAEHYLPLLYILGLKGENEKISFFNDKLVGGSLSMTSLKVDKQ
jgi:4,5-DOPA dioxygenase extradiol